MKEIAEGAMGALKHWPVIHSLATSISPLIASQFDWSSAKYFDYKSKKIFLEAYRDFVEAEIRNLADLRHDIRLRLYDSASLEERIVAQEKMRLVSEEINQLLIYKKVPEHIAFAVGNENSDQATEPVSEVWVDRFNDLARRQNEEWRSDLMASAFAKESASPGSVGLDVIHMLGILDQTSFYNFAALLQLSFQMYELRCIPSIDGNLMERTVVVQGRDRTITHILFQLEHVGLFAGDMSLGLNLQSGVLCQLRYGDEVLAIKAKTSRFYSALITTRLGASLANLCALQTTDQGWEIFNSAEEAFIRDGVFLKRWTV